MKKTIPLLVFSALLLLLTSSAQSQQIQLQTVATGLLMPTSITYAPDGSGRLFVTLQSGTIVILNGAQSPTTFLDISSLIVCCGERGLLGLAFHPDYATNGLFFVYYTDVNGNSAVARYSVSGNPNVANPASAQVILSAQQPAFTNHKAGQLQFGRDGFLYIGLGDGGSGGDPGNRGQDLTTLLGKILRIDIDTALYSVPANNPFLANPSARPEIWAYGLRNPWRFSFDRLTGDLYIADVGQNMWEEVNFQAAGSAGGENYGWRLMEGTHCFNPSVDCNPGGLVLPIIEYSHSIGCSVTGGYVFRGTSVPSLVGSYLYSDFCSGQIWAATRSGGVWQSTQLLASAYNISTFGEDQSGELYFADYGGQGVFKIVGTATPALGADFGSQGLWVFGNGVWNQLKATSPANVASYGQKLVAVFPGDGIYEYNGAVLTLISSNTAVENIIGADKIYVDAGAAGLWQWDGVTWGLLSGADPSDIAASGASLFASFAEFGLWQMQGGSWTRILEHQPATMAALGTDLYANFGVWGLWQWSGNTWTQISDAVVQKMAAGDFSLFVDFSPWGIWQWNGAQWTHLLDAQPLEIVAAGTTLYANFGASGLWQWNGASWGMLSSAAATDIAVSGSTLYANFGASGLWQWNGSVWGMLSANSPELLVPVGR